MKLVAIAHSETGSSFVSLHEGPAKNEPDSESLSLKDVLMKSGRVEYGSRYLLGNTAITQIKQQITDASVDASGCQNAGPFGLFIR